MPYRPPLAPLATLFVCVLAAASRPASGWSNKEHIQLTRIAAARLIADPATPPGMKAWLTDATPGLRDMAGEREFFLTQRVGVFPRGVDGLPFWATAPDLHAMMDSAGGRPKPVAPFGVGERLLHYIDLEFFVPDEARRSYAHDLSNKPKVADVPRDMADPRFQRAGMLPFRVEQCYRDLVKNLRAGRLNDKPGQHPRDEHAAKWAGFIAHYLEDNTQPQHATVDYMSKSYFGGAAKRQAPNVHADVEYRLVDDEFEDYPELRAALWDEFVKALDEVQDPVKPGDLFQETLEVSMACYDALPMIGEAAVAAYGADGGKDFNAKKFFEFKGKFQGREMTLGQMKARQLAWAVKRVEKVWLRAWDEAHAPAGAGTPVTEPAPR